MKNNSTEKREMSIDFQDNLYRDAKISRCKPAHIPKGIKNTRPNILNVDLQILDIVFKE